MNKKDLLEAIEKTGSVSIDEAMSKHKININPSHIINRSSGLPRIQTNITKKFVLILSQPEELQEINKYLIRCALCGATIHYPAWYYKIEYNVNTFHYFVCFDKSSPAKPNCNCYRR